jgi:phage terminase large subunit-like protein
VGSRVLTVAFVAALAMATAAGVAAQQAAAPEEKPANFDNILQSWDTANKDTELADFSVCTTWGVTGQTAYLLHVFRKKLEFPGLKKAVRNLAAEHKATVVLVEDKASGSSLIQELRADGFSIVQAAPNL